MSARLDRVFSELRARGRKALVTYLCIGDPSIDESIALARACIEAGADILELGVPFSDPTADGPSIARASQRAIAAGGGLDATLRAAESIRRASDVPIVLFGYYNPLFVRGEQTVVDDAARAGVDALLIVDLPLEEGEVLRKRAAELGLSIVPLVAPTSAPGRADAIAKAEGRPGFIYYVSVTGVTGAAAAPLADASQEAGRLREKTGVPAVVGFGIDSPEKAKVAAAHADGVVVGTALVQLVERNLTPDTRQSEVRAFVASLRRGLDGA